jgi:hypothetical protein
VITAIWYDNLVVCRKLAGAYCDRRGHKLRLPYKCLRCGLVNPMGSVACQSCGNTLTGGVAKPSAAPAHVNTKIPMTSSQQTSMVGGQLVTSATSSQGLPSISSVLVGAETIDGRVIQVDAMYLQKPDTQWGSILLKLLIYGATVYYFGFKIIIPIAALWLVLWLISKILPKGLLTGVAVQVLSFLLTRKMMGPAANVPVRDVRVRDASGIDHLVRVKGHLVAGSLSVGDEVIVEGRNRNDTFICRRGHNKSINTAIALSQR